MRHEKLHAVVARSTFPSQNAQNTRGSDHFWRFRCERRFTPNIRLSKVRLSKTAAETNGWRYRAWVRIGFCKIGWLAAKKDHFICRSLDLLQLQKMAKKTVPTPVLRHYSTLHSTTTYNYNYTPLHYTTLHYTTLH